MRKITNVTVLWQIYKTIVNLTIKDNIISGMVGNKMWYA